MNLIQNYQNIQSKYESYFSDKDKVLNNLMNAEKEYNHELEKINISSEDGLYSDALNLYKLYESQIKEVQKAAENRDEAIAKMKVALEECVIDGVETNIDFLYHSLINLMQY